MGHFRKFIDQFARKSKPLTIFLKKNKPWVWSAEQQKAYEYLKGYMIAEPILKLFDSTKDTIFHTDASRVGLAGMLVQVGDGNEKVVGYYSKTTTPTEQRYHSFELEALAIITSVRRFRHFNWKILQNCYRLFSYEECYDKERSKPTN